MFQNIGWPEIICVMIVGLIVIGPERLPELLKDVRAAIYAARKAINNAKAELDQDFGEEFEEFRKPIAEVARWQRMGPRRALTEALFDGDDSYLDALDPKTIMDSEETAGEAYRRARRARRAGASAEVVERPAASSAARAGLPSAADREQGRAPRARGPQRNPDAPSSMGDGGRARAVSEGTWGGAGGAQPSAGFDWEDIL